MKIPPQYLPVMPYLILQDAQGFWKFAQQVFGATEQMMVPADNDGIMHGEIKIKDAVIMFATATSEWSPKPGGMFLFVNDVDDVYAAAMKNGAKSLMEPQQREYGYTAGFDDPFGNQWWITAGE
jgi:PhnB protein